MSVTSEKSASSKAKAVKPPPSRRESDKPTPSEATNARADLVEQRKARRRSRSPPYVSDDPLALIRKRELARLLGVNPWTIDGWRKAGTIPPPIILSGQIVAWKRSDIEAWLDERKAQAVVAKKKKRAK
jgi:predicted DNA-binding transcriptional regulator AlpA